MAFFSYLDCARAVAEASYNNNNYCYYYCLPNSQLVKLTTAIELESVNGDIVLVYACVCVDLNGNSRQSKIMESIIVGILAFTIIYWNQFCVSSANLKVIT